MVTVIQIELDQQYAVLNAEVVETSGNVDFDTSAVSAIYLASPFQELAGLSSETFNDFFKNLRLAYTPTDSSFQD